jgi:phosphoribosylformimino-5-aminoimidazole carboxamide ribonucleotide (ProFAR) isomerase
VKEPALVDSAADELPVAVGLDHRDGDLAVHGWTEGSGVQLSDALEWYPRAAAFVITDIGRDGMLQGPDIEGLAAAAAATDVPVIASGGVASLDDIAALALIPGLGGVITGKALYEGRFTVAEALRVLS